MVTPEEAIVGRSTPLRVSAKHFITGQPMQAPFPEGNDVAVFATGAPWLHHFAPQGLLQDGTLNPNPIP